MLLAKIKEKLFNRRNKVEIEDVEVKGDIPVSIKVLIKSLSGNSLKAGQYIYNEDTEKLEYVEDIPEDYIGNVYYFGDDYFSIQFYRNGIGDDGEAIFSSLGANKLDFPQLTHSFNELDPTLKSICETAISTGEPQPCNQAQWEVIKALLDNSLYLAFGDYRLIKQAFNGIDDYSFGFLVPEELAMSLHIVFYSEENKLGISYYEI